MTTKNLSTDFGGSLASWNTFYAAQGSTCTLIVPAGTYTADDGLADVGPGAAIIGSGSSITTINGPIPQSFTLVAFKGGQNGSQPRIQNAWNGNKSITLTNSSNASRYSVGQYVLILGIDMQHSGYPQNNAIFEYKKITAIDSVGGVLSLNAPLVNDYKATWPLVNDNSALVDECGSATAIGMNSSGWDATHVVNGITLDSTVDWFGTARDVTWNDCIFPDWPQIPTQNISITFNGCTMIGDVIEVDKQVETASYNGCTIRFMQVQSSTVNNLNMTNCTVTETAQGTPKNFHAINCELGALTLGPTTYGAAHSAVLERCDATSLGSNPINSLVDLTPYTWSGPTFTAAKSDILPPNNGLAYLVPGGWYVLYGTMGSFTELVGPVFQITDIIDNGASTPGTAGSGPYTYHTNLTQTPTQITNGSATFIARHPCPSLTANGCTGALAIFSYSPAIGLPLGAYYNSGIVNSFVNNAHGNINAYINCPTWGPVFGQLQKITVNVIKPYTGVQNFLPLNVFSQFNQLIIWTSSYTQSTYYPGIDLLTAGTRIITPGNVIGAVGQDFGLSYPTGIPWGVATAAPSLQMDISSESSAVWPIFTVEVIFDQGIPNPLVQVPFSYSVDSGLGSATKMVPG